MGIYIDGKGGNDGGGGGQPSDKIVIKGEDGKEYEIRVSAGGGIVVSER